MKLVLALAVPFLLALAVASCEAGDFTPLPNPNDGATGVGPGGVTPNDGGGTTPPDATPGGGVDGTPGVDTATGSTSLPDEGAVIDFGVAE